MSDENEIKSIKHRVLGTLVLISLAVIFLPILFSKNDEFFSKSDEFIPAPPEKLKTIIYRLDDDGVFKLQGEPVASAPQQAEAAAVDNTPAPVKEAAENALPAAKAAQPTKVEQGNVTPNLPEGLKRWMAQLGSFSKEDNALELRDKIRQMGHPAFVDKRQSGDKWIWRVRVGPYVTEKEAQTTLETLQKKLKLKGLVIRHQ